MFGTLATVPQPVMSQHMADILKLMMRLALSRELPISYRDGAAQFVMTIMENKPGNATWTCPYLSACADCVVAAKVARHGLVDQVMQVCYALVCEPFQQEDPFSQEDLTAQVHTLFSV